MSLAMPPVMKDLPEGDSSEPHRDPLTGAVTEKALLRFVEAVLGMAEPSGPQIGMLCLGIDGLDALAAFHGPAVRDAVLLGIGDRMHERVRVQDLVGRIDDGFGICLAEILPAQASGAAERLLRAVRRHPVPTSVGALPLTCSIGLVLSRGGLDSAASLMARARGLRDAARQAGGNALLVASPEQ